MDFTKRPYYITTPIYYVNDAPHIGHAYSTLLADALARYHRLFGEEVHFLTGTDEHGQKVQRAAASSGRDPQSHCDALSPKFRELWSRLSVSNDDFIRTTESRHTSVVSRVLADLYSRDEIYRGTYSGWYCVPCERFFAQEELRVCPGDVGLGAIPADRVPVVSKCTGTLVDDRCIEVSGGISEAEDPATRGACPECGCPVASIHEPCYFLLRPPVRIRGNSAGLNMS